MEDRKYVQDLTDIVQDVSIAVTVAVHTVIGPIPFA